MYKQLLKDIKYDMFEIKAFVSSLYDKPKIIGLDFAYVIVHFRYRDICDVGLTF